jgi:hypothetical protein
VFLSFSVLSCTGATSPPNRLLAVSKSRTVCRWRPVAIAGPASGGRMSRKWGVSSNGAENWEKVFSWLDSLGPNVYVRVYGNP